MPSKHAFLQARRRRRRLRTAVPPRPGTAAAVAIAAMDERVRDDRLWRLRHDQGRGQRDRDEDGAVRRAGAAVRENRPGRRRTRAGRPARGARRRPDRVAAAELPVGQVRVGRRRRAGPAGRHHRPHRRFRTRPDRRQQRVPVAVELQGVPQVRVHVRQQRRVPRRARRPAAARRRHRVGGRVRVPERRARRLLRHVPRGPPAGRAGRPADGRRAAVHVHGDRSVRPRQKVRRHRPSRRVVRPRPLARRRFERHGPRHRHVLSRATHDFSHFRAPLSGRHETGHGVHRRTGHMSGRRRSGHVGRWMDHCDKRRFESRPIRTHHIDYRQRLRHSYKITAIN